MSILTLPDELLRHVATFVDDLEQGPFAAACRGTRAIVQAHRCGVVLHLPRGEATRPQILAAFGLKPAELPCSGVPFRSTFKYNLRRCVPIIIETYGWAGIAARRQRELDEARAKSKRKRETDRIVANRLAQLRSWLRQVYNIDSFGALVYALERYHLEVPPLYNRYVSYTKRNGGPEYRAVLNELTTVLERMVSIERACLITQKQSPYART